MNDKPINENMIVNQIIKDYPQTVETFSSFGIDSCCGGAFPLKEAAAKHGISLEEILEKLNKKSTANG